jgi:hypothetical protein
LRSARGHLEAGRVETYARALLRLLTLAIWLVVAVGAWITALRLVRALGREVLNAVGCEVLGRVGNALAVICALYAAQVARHTVCGGVAVAAVLADEVGVVHRCLGGTTRRSKSGNQRRICYWRN